MQFQNERLGTFELVVGNRVRLLQSFLPPELDGQFLVITKIEGAYPCFYDGSQHSGISPELIIEVAEAQT